MLMYLFRYEFTYKLDGDVLKCIILAEEATKPFNVIIQQQLLINLTQRH
jgi:hypothetical protein